LFHHCLQTTKPLCRTYSNYIATTNEWIGILKIACEHDFIQVKQLAIRGLEETDLSIVERLRIYQLYNVDPSHTVPLLSALCLRDEGPTDEETEQLGMKTSLLIYRARESLRSLLPADIDHGMVTSTICSLMNVDPSHFQKSGGLVIFRAIQRWQHANAALLVFSFEGGSQRRQGEAEAHRICPAEWLDWRFQQEVSVVMRSFIVIASIMGRRTNGV
jgi:hypothetical protein